VKQTIRLTIDSIAAGGDGVGRADGLVVFVPRTAPGDVITATIAGKKRFARGVVRDIVEPSPSRVEPSCVHYTRDKCGGCQLQHITYTSQLAVKQRIITDAMRRIGKREVTPPLVTPSPNEWRYRTKLTLALRRQGARWIAGLHAYDDPGRVFSLEECPITDARVVETWHEIMKASRFLPDDVRELRGSVRWTDDGPVFALFGGREWDAYEDFFEAVPSLAALYWESEEQSRILLADRREMSAPSASFSQVNPGVAHTLRQHVEERVLDYQPETVIDGYAGNGELAIRLTQRGIVTRAIELDPDAAEWSAQRLPAPSQSLQGKVEDLLPSQLPADVVVLNPPRGGLHEAIPETLQQVYHERRAPRAIIYVSCDPATLARDIGRLSSYRIQSMLAFDMFPQTSHVETVCELVPVTSSVGAVA
jgi:23S rRNA (uracil1939-C5)-methyltransferase